MSAVRRDTAKAGRRVLEVAESVPMPRMIAVTWSVSRRALADRAPEGACRVLDLTVALDRLGPAARGTVTLTDPVSARCATLDTFGPVAAEVIDDIHDTVHLEAPGVLHATLSLAGGGCRLVYARSPLLAALGIPGGRAQAMSARAGP